MRASKTIIIDVKKNGLEIVTTMPMDLRIVLLLIGYREKA